MRRVPLSGGVSFAFERRGPPPLSPRQSTSQTPRTFDEEGTQLMASIEKTETTTGVVRYRVRWRVAGRLTEKWFTRYEDARTQKTQAEADALTGIAIDPRAGRRLLNDYFDAWIDVRLVKGKPLSPSTRVGYERLWKRNVHDTIGKRELRAIRKESVRDWHSAVATRSGPDQSAKSYRLLRAVLATAEADDLIRANPCRIRGAGQEHAAERPMVATSLVLDLAGAIERRYRAIVLLAGFASLRTGENLGLRRADVDLLHREISVVVQAQELKGEGRTVSEPKSEAGRRRVAIPSIVVGALGDHLAEFTEPDADSPVFTGPAGAPLRRATLSAAWRRALRTTCAPDDGRTRGFAPARLEAPRRDAHRADPGRHDEGAHEPHRPFVAASRVDLPARNGRARPSCRVVPRRSGHQHEARQAPPVVEIG